MVRRPRLRLVNIPGGEVTAHLIAETARAAGAEVTQHCGGRARCRLGCARVRRRCLRSSDHDRRQRCRPHRCRDHGIGRRGEVIAHGIAPSPAAPRRSAASAQCRPWRCLARRTRPLRHGGRWRGPCSTACRRAAAQDAFIAAGAQDRLYRRHRRGRLCWNTPRAPGCRSRSGIYRLTRSPAPMPGLLVPGSSEGFAAGTPVDAYMLRE